MTARPVGALALEAMDSLTAARWDSFTQQNIPQKHWEPALADIRALIAERDALKLARLESRTDRESKALVRAELAEARAVKAEAQADALAGKVSTLEATVYVLAQRCQLLGNDPKVPTSEIEAARTALASYRASQGGAL